MSYSPITGMDASKPVLFPDTNNPVVMVSPAPYANFAYIGKTDYISNVTVSETGGVFTVGNTNNGSQNSNIFVEVYAFLIRQAPTTFNFAVSFNNFANLQASSFVDFWVINPVTNTAVTTVTLGPSTGVYSGSLPYCYYRNRGYFFVEARSSTKLTGAETVTVTFS